MGNSFSGFTPESLSFFESLAANNNKVWFEEHRDDFEQCLMEPLKGLVSDLSGAMLAIDPELVTIPAVDKTISRIYRDTRFSRNKSPYKTCPLDHLQAAESGLEKRPLFLLRDQRRRLSLRHGVLQRQQGNHGQPAALHRSQAG